MQTGFAQIIRDNGIDAALRENSTDPTSVKREAFLDALMNGLFSQGAAHINPTIVRRALEAPGGGPNGQSISQAYGGTKKVKDLYKALRQFRIQRFEDMDRDKKARNIRIEDDLRNAYNQILDSTGTFTLDNLRALQQQAQSETMGGAGYSSQFLNSIANTTEEVQEMQQSMANANKMAAAGALTMDYVNTKMVFTHTQDGINKRRYYQNLAISQERMNATTPVGAALAQIKKDVIEQNPRVKAFYDNGTNLYSVGRAQDAVARKFRETFELVNSINPELNEHAAIEQATKAAIAERERLYKTVNDQGNFEGFGVSSANQRQAQLALSAGKTFQADVKKIVRKFRLSDPKAGKKLVKLLGGKESLQNQLDMFNSDAPPSIPVTVKYVASEYGVNPLTIYNLVAPVVGKRITAVQGIQESFKPKFSRARNKYRYVSERVGRANIGDTKILVLVRQSVLA